MLFLLQKVKYDVNIAFSESPLKFIQQVWKVWAGNVGERVEISILDCWVQRIFIGKYDMSVSFLFLEVFQTLLWSCYYFSYYYSVVFHHFLQSSLQTVLHAFFMYASVFLWALLLTDLTDTLVLLTLMMKYCQRAGPELILIFIHNSVCINSFCTAFFNLPFRGLHICYTILVLIIVISTLLYVSVPYVSRVYWNLYSRVGELKKRLLAVDRIK